ncbi:hypothetical protein DEU40_12718 [Chryseobacterium sp. AG844]|nr:hypothetical protein DEU40_12718 [Chryseobacterium sp. AG844]
MGMVVKNHTLNVSHQYMYFPRNTVSNDFKKA